MNAARGHILTPRAVFSVAWVFWTIAAALGLLLRLQVIHPLPAVHYGHLLHTHSHLAFLGWVYNAFFALALQVFVAPADTAAYRRLFLVTQVAVTGMLFTYPFTGYAAASIAFSTLHMICAGVFAWKLLRRNTAAPLARAFLGTAFGCMLLSGLGPLTLGPLAAAGLRETPWYPLSIYFYLHFQYNGWFVFFLLAVLYQQMHARGSRAFERPARHALGWLAGGAILTLGLSALWLDPPGWVFVAAGLGGTALLVGTAYLLQSLRGSPALFTTRQARLARTLAGIAAGALLLKHGLQFVGAWPGLATIANQRFVVIGFIHLVFLGFVTPLLLAWALEFRWLHLTFAAKVGLALFGIGAAVTQLTLFYSPAASLAGWLAGPNPFPILLASAATMAVGVAAMLPGCFTREPINHGSRE